jgi:hypothetical protein
MFRNPSLVTRIAIGKGLGFLIGLIGMLSIPYFAPEIGWMFRWGVLLWYATLGAIVGMFGVFTWHPVLKLPLPWWFRASLVGGWMNFVLVLFAFDHFAAMMTTIFGVDGIFQSPFWFTLEGALVGLIIGYFATKFGGEGAETVIADQPD